MSQETLAEMIGTTRSRVAVLKLDPTLIYVDPESSGMRGRRYTLGLQTDKGRQVGG